MPGPPFPAAGAADDWDQDAEMAAYLADIDARRAREPDQWGSTFSDFGAPVTVNPPPADQTFPAP